MQQEDWQTLAVNLEKHGLSWRAIAEAINKPKSTVSDFLRKYKTLVNDSAEEVELSSYLASSPTRMDAVPEAHDNSRILCISDMHIPYHHEKALVFLEGLKKRYEPTRIINLGDECFPPDVEVLTERGFVRFDALTEGQKVAQWHEDASITFVEPERRVVKEYQGPLLEFKHKTMCSRTTPKHSLVKIHPVNKTVHKREAWDSAGSESWYIPRAGVLEGTGCSLGLDQLRLLVAFQADGTWTKGAARFMFTKERKAERLVTLLRSCGVSWNEHNMENGYQFYIEVVNVPAFFSKVFDDVLDITTLSLEQRRVFLEELPFWDGTHTRGGFRYSSCVEENVLFVEAVAATSGIAPGKIFKQRNNWVIDIQWERENCSLKSAKRKEVDHNGKVYCVTVPTGMIVVKTDGYVHVSGNCDQHAMSFHDHDPDLDSAGKELERALPVIAELHRMFPKMDLIDSNHGSMVYRKAKHHGIPRRYIKSYNDVLGVGAGWKWHMDLTIQLPDEQWVYFHHGKSVDAIKVSQAMGMNHVCGHYHESFGIKYWSNPLHDFWGMNIGCLINDSALAFAYNNVNIKRPIIGTGLIIDGIPVLELMAR